MCGADLDPAAGAPLPDGPFVLDDLTGFGGGVATGEDDELLDEPCLVGVAGDGGRSIWMPCPTTAVAPSLSVTVRVTL